MPWKFGRAFLILIIAGFVFANGPLSGQTTPAVSGTVIETMNAGGYTYVCIDTGKEKIWAAAPQTQIATGAKVDIPPGSPMAGFHSKTLDRTFPQINFVPSINLSASAAGGESPAQIPVPAAPPSGTASSPEPLSGCAAGGTCPSGACSMSPATGSSPALPIGHPTMPRGDIAIGAASPTIITGIARADGGKTIAEIYAEKASLAGKEIRVRGKVVKFNPDIMKKNWIHIQDGSGSTDSNDLTITTQDKVKVGDTILVTGTLQLDKDFGFGYRYQIIVEEAKVTIE